MLIQYSWLVVVILELHVYEKRSANMTAVSNMY